MLASAESERPRPISHAILFEDLCEHDRPTSTSQTGERTDERLSAAVDTALCVASPCGKKFSESSRYHQ